MESTHTSRTIVAAAAAICSAFLGIGVAGATTDPATSPTPMQTDGGSDSGDSGFCEETGSGGEFDEGDQEDEDGGILEILSILGGDDSGEDEGDDNSGQSCDGTGSDETGSDGTDSSGEDDF